MRMCRKTILAANERCSLNFHIVSRIVDRSFKLKEVERTMFVKMMREYEDFCGLEVKSFCIMSNHIHLLVKVPPKSDVEIEDEEFIRRLKVLYGPDKMQMVERLLKECRKNHASKAARELKEAYSYRMGDVSEFMKSLKQRFSMWYNKEHSRSGTLWEDRYSLTLVGEGNATQLTAAYIDLNPLRAGMVKDPADYEWSSYGEAVAGKSLARARLFGVMSSVEPGANAASVAPADEKDALRQYRMLLAVEGQAADMEAALVLGERKSKRRKRSRGFTKKEVAKILKRGGKLTLNQMLRCKVRYFTVGFAIGSEEFVNGVMTVIKEETGMFQERKSGASKLKHGGETGLYSLRNLRKAPIDLK